MGHQYQRLVIINDIYQVKYSVRNNLDKHKHFLSQKLSLKCYQATKTSVFSIVVGSSSESFGIYSLLEHVAVYCAIYCNTYHSHQSKL